MSDVYSTIATGEWTGVARLAAADTVSAVELDVMRVTIQLPEDISAALKEQWDDVPRRSLEAIAVEGYRTGALTEPQLRRLHELDLIERLKTTSFYLDETLVNTVFEPWLKP